jgi:hypothetical protein
MTTCQLYYHQLIEHVQVSLGDDNSKIQFWNFVVANDRMPGLMTADPKETSDLAEYQSSRIVQFLEKVSRLLQKEAISLNLKDELMENLTDDLKKRKYGSSSWRCIQIAQASCPMVVHRYSDGS